MLEVSYHLNLLEKRQIINQFKYFLFYLITQQKNYNNIKQMDNSDSENSRFQAQDENFSVKSFSQLKPLYHTDLWPVLSIPINPDNIARLEKTKLTDVQKNTLLKAVKGAFPAKELIKEYTKELADKSFYKGLNKALEERDIQSGFLIGAGMLNWALQQAAKKSESEIFYRGSSWGQNLKVGQTFWNHTFLSTSIQQKQAHRFDRKVQFMITDPVRPGYFIAGLSDKPNEKEVLFSPHSKWVVTKITPGKKYIHNVEYIEIQITGID